MGDKQCRQEARACAAAGVAAFAHGFNACENMAIPYRYSKDVLLRFMELGIELKQLIEHGEIEENPAFALWQQARRDDAVQQLIAAASQGKGRGDD